MKPSVAFENNRALVREVVGRYRTTNPRLFGSVLHGTDKEGSDVDILVDALPGATLFDLGGLEEELTEKLGVRVQVVTPQELHRFFKDKVLAEAQPV
ncbi:MAG: nucleotidyltransferase [Devosia sp. 67-54]|uniref:nucleotidyltransferase family protein n=1 Tax=unclassified Devosia TaxID=196773 RepID=UPI000963CB98|nr:MULTISPECIES: nucleotidyltransferase family protein [unclassified Devosia]MBN9306170.1 nucleotidyltransferase family protein [Devosia sp.]OJX18251.1 MAG: nucleotidyltransferase [Devosia sp. 67-54]